MSIRIFYDETNFRLKGWWKTRKLVEKVILKENKFTGDLSFIITDDETLQRINVQFLEHDYYTDVITFNNNSGDLIGGEIYISVDTVKKNAFNYNVSLNQEILRVMIHGVLHLLGYDDNTDKKREEMRQVEDSWIKVI